MGLGAVAASQRTRRSRRFVLIWMMRSSLWRERRVVLDAINTREESLHDRLLQELTEGRGPDVAIEAIGTPRLLSEPLSKKSPSREEWCTSAMRKNR